MSRYTFRLKWKDRELELSCVNGCLRGIYLVRGFLCPWCRTRIPGKSCGCGWWMIETPKDFYKPMSDEEIPEFIIHLQSLRLPDRLGEGYEEAATGRWQGREIRIDPADCMSMLGVQGDDCWDRVMARYRELRTKT